MLSSWNAVPYSAQCSYVESSSFPEKSPQVKEAGGFMDPGQHCDLHPETTAVGKFQEQIPQTADAAEGEQTLSLQK